MTLSIYPRTDGAYLAFGDQDGHRYILERDRGLLLHARLHAHLRTQPDRTLLDQRRFIRDPKRDHIVLEIYVQDCDDFFEIVTSTGPQLQTTAVEVGTLLGLAVEQPAPIVTRRSWTIPPASVPVDPALIPFPGLEQPNGIPFG